ncbi:MAG: BspA family leucine-rich repeat surface protein [Anaerolineaceae bacterium]|nr:BspA family leucine-rich repeat surface protein [Anaerolineaceae bacterium]
MKKLCIRIWLLMLCLCSRNVYAEEGTCGTNVKYTTSNDTVTFSKADPASEAVWGNCGDVFQYAPKYRVIKVSDTLRVESDGGLFYDFPYVRKMYLSDLDVSDVTNMTGMFADCSSLTDLDVSGWDTSGVISMHSMFSNCSSLTSLDVSSWDTSNVIDMDAMFANCGSLTSLDLSKWDTSNVIEMVSMFYGCRSLTNLDVSGWDTSDVTNMSSMFEDCRSLTDLDLSDWDTSNVNDTYEWEGMFLGCNSLSVITLGKDSMSGANIFFDLPKAYNTWVYTAQGEIASDPLPLNTAKSDASLFEEYDHRTMAGTWSVSENAGAAAENQSAGEGTCGVNVKYTVSGDTVTFSKADPASEAVWEDCGSVFQNDPKYRTVKVSDTIRIKDGRDLFDGFPYVREMYLANFDVSGVTDMSGMFAGCSSLTTLDVSSWDTSAVTNMTSMFDGCRSLTDPDVSCWDTSNVTRMRGMFNNCASLTDPDVSRWDTSAVTSMSGMFDNCISLTGPDVNGWDISSVTDMYSMFQGCVSLTGLNISGWDTSAVTGMTAMFKDCSSLKSLNLSGWDTSNLEDIQPMFSGCNSLSVLTLGKNTMAGGNMFFDLPKAYDTWVYTVQGETVSDPLPLNTEKSDASLFEEYDHRTMAGTWSAENHTP